MDWIKLVLSLVGGLGLFLYGMKLMSDGLEAAAGSQLRRWLEALTGNRFIGVLVGAAITAIIQSSSATTVMVVSFVNAGLMQLSQAVGLIMGANIGTTVTGILVTLKVSMIAPVATFIGIAIVMFAKKKKLQSIGQIIAGFGILFMGMDMMSAAMKPLSGSPDFMHLIQQARNPLIGVLVGALLTALIQSSSAFTGVLIALAMAGVLDFQTGIFLVFGTNIGTCITAILASLGANRTAKRAATVHLLFNAIGTGIFLVIALLPIGFVGWIENLIPNSVAGQIAITHVIFNIVTTVLLFPFANQLVFLASKIIPGKDKERAERRLEYLDSRTFDAPLIAVTQVHKEVERMANMALENYRLASQIFLKRQPELVEDALVTEEVINFLNHEITRFLVKISALNLDYTSSKLVGSLYHVVNDIERVGDHAENIVEFSQAYIDNEKFFSEEAIDELTAISSKVEKMLAHAIDIFSAGDYVQSEMDKVRSEEKNIDSEIRQYKENHIKRLEKDACTQSSGALFINMLNDLERVADHAENIALSLRYQL